MRDRVLRSLGSLGGVCTGQPPRDVFRLPSRAGVSIQVWFLLSDFSRSLNCVSDDCIHFNRPVSFKVTLGLIILPLLHPFYSLSSGESALSREFWESFQVPCTSLIGLASTPVLRARMYIPSGHCACSSPPPCLMGSLRLLVTCRLIGLCCWGLAAGRGGGTLCFCHNSTWKQCSQIESRSRRGAWEAQAWKERGLLLPHVVSWLKSQGSPESGGWGHRLLSRAVGTGRRPLWTCW